MPRRPLLFILTFGLAVGFGVSAAIADGPFSGTGWTLLGCEAVAAFVCGRYAI